jgi:small subunit ribosomal protein S6
MVVVCSGHVLNVHLCGAIFKSPGRAWRLWTTIHGYGGPLVRLTTVGPADRRGPTHQPSCHGETVAAESTGGGFALMRNYEVMVILDPDLEERTVAPSLDQYLNLVRKEGGSVETVDVWGRRRLAYEIKKKAEGIYAVIQLSAEPATVKELDRQLGLNESVLRTKVIRPEVH